MEGNDVHYQVVIDLHFVHFSSDERPEVTQEDLHNEVHQHQDLKLLTRVVVQTKCCLYIDHAPNHKEHVEKQSYFGFRFDVFVQQIPLAPEGLSFPKFKVILRYNPAVNKRQDKGRGDHGYASNSHRQFVVIDARFRHL